MYKLNLEDCTYKAVDVLDMGDHYLISYKSEGHYSTAALSKGDFEDTEAGARMKLRECIGKQQGNLIRRAEELQQQYERLGHD